MTAVETAAGGLHLHQARRLVTEVPGPRSLELAARRRSAVPAGLTSSAGVYAAAAGGGVLVDVDGKAEALGHYETALGDFRRLTALAERLTAVTADDVARVVRTYLQPARRTIVIAEPEADDDDADDDEAE